MFSNSYVWTQNRLPLSEIINWNQKKEKTTRFWDMSFFLQFRPIYSSLPCLAICSITSQCHRFSSVQKRPTPSDLKCWLQLKLTVDIFQSSKTLFNFNREFLVKVVRGWSWYLSYYQSQNNKKNIIQVIKFYMTQREKTFDLYSELKIYRWKFNLFFLVSSMEKCNVFCKISFSSIHQTVLFLLFESM